MLLLLKSLHENEPNRARNTKLQLNYRFTFLHSVLIGIDKAAQQTQKLVSRTEPSYLLFSPVLELSMSQFPVKSFFKQKFTSRAGIKYIFVFLEQCQERFKAIRRS